MDENEQELYRFLVAVKQVFEGGHFTATDVLGKVGEEHLPKVTRDTIWLGRKPLISLGMWASNRTNIWVGPLRLRKVQKHNMSFYKVEERKQDAR